MPTAPIGNTFTIDWDAVQQAIPQPAPHPWPNDPALSLLDGLVQAHPLKFRNVVPATEGAPPRLIQDCYNYPGLKLRKSDSAAYERVAPPIKEPFPWTTTQGLVGIEVEVENIRHSVPLMAYWDGKADGSLRNSGAEYVSVPLQIKQIQSALQHLYATLKATNQYDFSNRTSIHVHVNCRDMTQDQVYVFCLLYTLFEKHFYKVAGTRRLGSIFCVPVFRTNILHQMQDVIYKLSPSWHKYCGLNILPLVDNNGQRGYGTIEFRHLYGTDDQTVICKWINDILCLRKMALKISKDELIDQIKSMNTTSSYMSLYHQVFEQGQKVLTDKRDFEDCVSNIKRELFGKEYQNTLARSDASAYWNFVQAEGIRG